MDNMVTYFWSIVVGLFCVSVLIVVYTIYLKVRDRRLLKTVTTLNRGTRSERELVIKLLKLGIPADTIFHDLYVQKSSGEFAQVDLVVVTSVGLIIFEVKEYSGWLFGNGNQSQWTEVLAYGKQKYRFYNPIMQNNGHITELRKQLSKFDTIPFFSIIVFYGDCVLRDISFIPKGTYLIKPNRLSDVLKDILNNNLPIDYSSKTKVLKVLREAVWNGEDAEIRIQHIGNIRNMLGKDRVYD